MNPHKPRLPPSRFDDATVILHRFDDRGGSGVNFLEVRLRDQQEPAERGTSGEGER